VKNSENFENSKQLEIEKLKKQNSILEKLLNNRDFFSNETVQKFEDIFDKNKKYLHKLESNEFEIAIVGLEKAGKSTFANALIENSVLPSAPERCTFTSTRLVNGSDRAVVEFYNESEFEDIFQNLLKDIEYPEAEKQSFKALSSEKFEEFFASLESKNSNLYKAHVGKTDEEIKDILKARGKLILNGSKKEFYGDELLKDSFQSYIKGENGGDDTSKPRSVKKVEIESSKLQKMDSAIIYDVPGFDSPTKIHERQTIERLKSADAIILVTNVGRNPSLVGTQLNIITKNADSDGIPLKDKLFTFGNQLDTANSKEESQGNIRTLQKDVAKYKIGEQKRIFTGSALQYLVEIGIKKEFKTSFELETSGVPEIRQELQNYYENERFEILKRKIDGNSKELKESFKKILEDFDTDFDPNFAENEKGRITREAYKEIENTLEKSLKELKFELKNEIWDERYFSKKFGEDVQNLSYFEAIDENEMKKAKIYEDESLSLDTPIEKMNQAIRKYLHQKFLQQFSNLIKYMTDEKSKDIEIRILRSFTSSVLGSENSLLFDEIEKESEKLIQKLTSDIAHNDGKFTYLIERFSRDIFDILISNPLLSQDRRDKFEKTETQFYFLDHYYNDGDGTLINMILSGKKKQLGASLETKTILNYANTLLSWTSNPYNFGNRINDIRAIANELQKIGNSQKVEKYNSEEILKSSNRSKTEDEVLKEINRDIENLRDILEKAVVPAISLETAFFNGVDKQIKILLDSFESHGTENSKIFNDFISKVVPKVKSAELGNINEKLEKYKLQKEVLKEIKEFEF
jgi:GTPase SAR1 family protein